jgi:hypothetical protein
MTTIEKSAAVGEIVKAAPAVLVAVPASAGHNWNETVLIATLIYIVLQIGYLLFRWWRLLRQPRAHSERDE